jgi:hypothetical protein
MTTEDREDRRRREERRFWFPIAQLFDPGDTPRRKRSERDSD